MTAQRGAYCTYFDSGYLARGLALYHSLRAQGETDPLWALCFDAAAYSALAALRLPGLYPIALEDFERGDKALLAAKVTRSQVEYYFTCTPSLPLYLLRQEPALERVTYLDADVFFFGSPQPLQQALEGHSLAITPHRFPARLRHLEKYGIYNVAWLAFRHDRAGLEALNWWRERCLEWCYDRLEPERFGDQKYLDDWPARFESVAVLDHAGANLAPWNFAQYRLRRDPHGLWVDDQPLIFYHFHGLKQPLPGLYDANFSNYQGRLSGLARRELYRPYLRALARAGREGGGEARQAPARSAELRAGPARRGLGQRLRGLARRGLHPALALWARQYLLAVGEHVY